MSSKKDSFNKKDFFPLPEPLIQKNISKVMSLRDGTKKMSKSEESDYSRINLKDTADDILKKIKKAKTDTLPLPSKIEELEKRPEAKNLIGIYSSLMNNTLQKSIDEFDGKNFSDFKEKLSDLLVEKITPISKEITKLLNDEKHLDSILFDGSQKADKIASKKIKKIKQLIGF